MEPGDVASIVGTRVAGYSIQNATPEELRRINPHKAELDAMAKGSKTSASGRRLKGAKLQACAKLALYAMFDDSFPTLFRPQKLTRDVNAWLKGHGLETVGLETVRRAMGWRDD
jgi:hypothetical protein